MNIVLCGMMGVGKSTVGIKIAELTNRRWIDTDTVITNRHGRILDIFEYYGEAHFRQLESEVVGEYCEKDDLVISTGGGLVLNWENAEKLKKNGKIFFLRASLDTILSRVQGDDTRPLLRNTDARGKLEKLLGERTSVYEYVSDYTIETDDKSADEVAKQIIELMEQA